MMDNSFDPAEVTVAAGQPLVFDNVGQVIHNAIDVDGAWTTDEAVEPGESDTVTIDEPGTYTFYCSLHAPPDGSAGMSGTLTVVAADEAVADQDGPVVDAQATDERIAAVEPVEPTGEVRQVPEDFPTIQSAVDAAEPGDLVLVGPGTYREQVNVATSHLVIRGTDREQVVVDGEFEREMGILVTADAVAVENMTVRDVTSNGFYWDGVTGFRGSYLTATNASVYGIYAFDSVDGVFEHSYASGSADGGYYIGQCQDCRTILNQVTAEWNGFGFSGTNASNSLYLVDSLWTNNGAGIVPNTLDSQRYAPSRGATIAGNRVISNGNFDAPVVSATWPAFGNGIMLAGGIHHTVVDNLVLDHPGYGIATTPNLSQNFWQPGSNHIEGNYVRGSGRADLVTAAPSQHGGDCFADNDIERTSPWLVRSARPCEGRTVPSFGSFRDTWLMMGQLPQFPGERKPQDMEGLPEPSGLEQMPGGADAPVRAGGRRVRHLRRRGPRRHRASRARRRGGGRVAHPRARPAARGRAGVAGVLRGRRLAAAGARAPRPGAVRARRRRPPRGPVRRRPRRMAGRHRRAGRGHGRDVVADRDRPDRAGQRRRAGASVAPSVGSSAVGGHRRGARHRGAPDAGAGGRRDARGRDPVSEEARLDDAGRRGVDRRAFLVGGGLGGAALLGGALGRGTAEAGRTPVAADHAGHGDELYTGGSGASGRRVRPVVGTAGTPTSSGSGSCRRATGTGRHRRAPSTTRRSPR
jgi:hypothetical protein